MDLSDDADLGSVGRLKLPLSGLSLSSHSAVSCFGVRRCEVRHAQSLCENQVFVPSCRHSSWLSVDAALLLWPETSTGDFLTPVKVKRGWWAQSWDQSNKVASTRKLIPSSRSLALAALSRARFPLHQAWHSFPPLTYQKVDFPSSALSVVFIDVSSTATWHLVEPALFVLFRDRPLIPIARLLPLWR